MPLRCGQSSLRCADRFCRLANSEEQNRVLLPGFLLIFLDIAASSGDLLSTALIHVKDHRRRLCHPGCVSSMGYAMATFRYDVVKEGREWVIATGGPTWRGHPSREAAIATAMNAARQVEARGYTVEAYVWDGQVSTRLMENAADLAAGPRDPPPGRLQKEM